MRQIASSRNTKTKEKSTQKLAFDAQTFLDSAGMARKVKEFKPAEVVYAQGDAASSVIYLQTGGVTLRMTASNASHVTKRLSRLCRDQ
jgi:CRP-like cAMP-binding protein